MAAHVRAKVLEPVVTAPTPAHMYCIRLVLETLQEVCLASSVDFRIIPWLASLAVYSLLSMQAG